MGSTLYWRARVGLCLPGEVRHCFCVEGLREKINRRCRDHTEGALSAEAGEVAGERCRVALHIGHIAGRRGGNEFDSLRIQTSARWIHHQNVGILVGEFMHRISADDIDVVDF